jgi:DNA-binding CsgD family transcriptional regulator
MYWAKQLLHGVLDGTGYYRFRRLPITPRSQQVLDLIEGDKTFKEIAVELKITPARVQQLFRGSFRLRHGLSKDETVPDAIPRSKDETD